MKKISIMLVGLLILSGCSTQEKRIYTDGEYIGVGEGKCGSIQVKINIEEDLIKDIEIIKDNETSSYMSEVKDKLISEIVGKKTLDGIDVVTGSTASSNGVLEAVQGALNDALIEKVSSGEKNEQKD